MAIYTELLRMPRRARLSYRKDRARQQRAMKELPNLLMASLSGDETSFLSSKTADIAPLTIPLAISERKRERGN